MWIGLLARVDGEEKGQVGVIGVEQVHLAEVLGVVARNGRKQRIELVVCLGEERTIGVREHPGKLAHLLIDRLEVGAVKHNRQRKIAECLAVAERPQALAKVLDVGLFRLIYQHVALVRLRWIAAHLRHETGLAHVEMATAFVHFFPGLCHRKWRPLGDDIEVALNLEEPVKDQRPCLCNGLFHREDADEMVADAEVVALRLDVGVDHLVVEVLRRLRLARNAPVIEVEQAAEEAKLRLLSLHLNGHEVGDLAGEVLYTLLQLYQVGVDLRP